MLELLITDSQNIDKLDLNDRLSIKYNKYIKLTQCSCAHSDWEKQTQPTF